MLQLKLRGDKEISKKVKSAYMRKIQKFEKKVKVIAAKFKFYLD